MKTILIAGGSGYIGKKLSVRLRENGFNVLILSRKPTDKSEVFWDPAKMEIDLERCRETSILVNLCGAGINEKRWTKKRKVELEQSRIDVTSKLYELTASLPLEYYIGASGISAYGFDDGSKEHREEDAFGTDFLSQLVKFWEQSSDLFQSRCTVSKIRIAVTLDTEAGAVRELSKLIRLGFGSVVGSGEQQIPWVAIDDLVDLFVFAIQNQLKGVYNSNTGNCSNRELTFAIATYYRRKIFLPAVPAFVLRFVLGEMSDLVLNGSRASNDKIRSKGFVPKYQTLSSVFDK